MSAQVFLNGSVYSPADPFATAMVVAEGQVEWVGQDAGARSILDPSMGCTDLGGNLVAPAFALGAAMVEPDQIPSFLLALAKAGYVSAHLMLTDLPPAGQQNAEVAVHYYLPAGKVSVNQQAGPAVQGIYCVDPAELTEQILEFAVNCRLSLVAVPSSEAAAEEYLDRFSTLDSLSRLRVSPCLGGLERAGASLIERAKDLGVTLGFSSAYDPTDNSYAEALATGASVVLGSDPLSRPLRLGWELVNFAVNPGSSGSAVSARAAFQSMTRAVYRAHGESNPWKGQLVPGAPACCAIWKVTELMVQTPDSRISAWSTDPRARTPLLPVLADDVPRPELVALYKDGQKIR